MWDLIVSVHDHCLSFHFKTIDSVLPMRGCLPFPYIFSWDSPKDDPTRTP